MTRSRATLVGLDTQILIWGMRDPSDLSPKAMHARWLMESLEKDSTVQLCISSIVAQEYLVHIPPPHSRSSVQAVLEEAFLILPFNMSCAALAAELHEQSRPKGSAPISGSRVCIKADCMIVAASRVAGVSKIYSNDPGFRTLASRAGVVCERVPTIPPTIFHIAGTP
jgi:predicted nucleic acid-binding protein